MWAQQFMCHECHYHSNIHPVNNDSEKPTKPHIPLWEVTNLIVEQRGGHFIHYATEDPTHDLSRSSPAKSRFNSRTMASLPTALSPSKQEEPLLLHIQTSHHMGLHINACLFDAAAHHITCRRLGWPKHHLARDVHIARPNKPTKAVSINTNCSPPASININCLKWRNKPTNATRIKINSRHRGASISIDGKTNTDTKDDTIQLAVTI